MIGDFGARNLDHHERTFAKPDDGDLKQLRQSRATIERLARDTLKNAAIAVEEHKVLVLVDLQGIYLNLHEWLRERRFPIDDGLLLSRFAFFGFQDVFDAMKAEVLNEGARRLLDFEGLLSQIKDGKSGVKIPTGASYVRFVPHFEVFYAPAPLENIEWQLRRYARSGSFEARQQLNAVRDGIVKKVGWFDRDYAAYDDFVAKLKANPEYSKATKGFFSFGVGPRGLKYFDEKAVDTSIVIRAMDAFYDYEADSLCVVSSDQDFVPLKARAESFGVQYYQADLAKFDASHHVGRALKNFGSRFIRGRFSPEWPLRVIIEAVSNSDFGVQQMYKLSEKELSALCELHNSMNDFHISLEHSGDGAASLKLAKPKN